MIFKVRGPQIVGGEDSRVHFNTHVGEGNDSGDAKKGKLVHCITILPVSPWTWIYDFINFENIQRAKNTTQTTFLQYVPKKKKLSRTN